MSGGYWSAPAAAPPRSPGRGKAVAAAALLVAAAGLAVGGSFGTFTVQSADFGPDGATLYTQSSTGWTITVTGLESGTDEWGRPPLNGVPLVVGGVLAVAAAVLLLLRSRGGRLAGAARGLAMLAAALLVGTVAAIWVDLVTSVRAAVDDGLGWGVEIGVGGWLLLCAALVAVVAGALAATSGTPPGRPAGPPSVAYQQYPAGAPWGPYPQAPGWSPYPQGAQGAPGPHPGPPHPR
jgi:hypothetical protein